MKIGINSTAQFDSLLNAMASEIVNAQCYFKLRMDLRTAIPDYKEVFNQSNTFWSLTLQALWDATLVRLCRAYDTHLRSLSLKNLLDTIMDNLAIFDTKNFKTRLHDNPFVESLAETARKPDPDTLCRDRDSVNSSDPLVKKLLAWRNKIIAHRDASNVVEGVDITMDYPLTIDEIRELLERATKILNTYSRLFRASTYSTQIIGHDDYLYVLRAIKEKVSEHRKEVASQKAKLRQSHDI